ncbi:MAG: hybrid sensor histidine kinase/response regulator [Deltaproteobacteria bacterium]|nr:MAG: hybrid sensor histidine kinase/response regulator [Deltaproteobacteria bacterium]
MSPPSPSVYIVEDEVLVGMELSERLHALGYRVLGRATGGDEAMGALQRLRPDLVIADIHLGTEPSGIALAEHLRRRDPAVPVVFLSARSDCATLDAARRVAPAGLLVQPWDERALHATLQVALARAAIERQREAAAADRLERELRRAAARHEASLYRMAAGMAQAFSNLLGVALAQIGLARHALDDPARLTRSLTEAEATIATAGRHLEFLRRYAGGGRPSLRRLDLGELCRRAAGDAHALLPAGARLAVVTDSFGPLVVGDPEMLAMAVGELLRNAGEALPEGGGEIELWAQEVTAGEVAALRWWPTDWRAGSGRFAAITVFDTGEGIADSDRPLVFEPFYSTRALGRGLGLAVVVAAARAAGGAVAVQSSPGSGTALRMVLPIDAGGDA